VSVRIRLKRLGRKNRPFYRVCAMDARTNRDGKVIEELGHYDPLAADTNARAILNGERIDHWLKIGALPTDKVRVLIEKYGPEGSHLDQQRTALERVSQPRVIPDPGPPASVPKRREEAQAPPPAAEAAAEPAAEAAAEPAAEAPAEPADEPQAEEASQ
jgi:small subunit ribosomal protein S16